MDELLAMYLQSDDFRRRADRMKRLIRLRAKAGRKEPTFEKMAAYQRVPVELLIADFQRAIAKAGMPIVPVGQVQ